jgi:2-methylcitrate synthase/citrate synthase II
VTLKNAIAATLEIEARTMTEEQEIYRPGLEGVIAGETSVSSLDGGLRYRGYGVEELCEKSTYEEVAYLVLHGELPTLSQLSAFNARIAKESQLPDLVVDVLRRVPKNADGMEVLRSACSLLAHFDPDNGDESHDANMRKAERLTAKFPLIVGAWNRIRLGKEPVAPKAGLGFAAQTLWLTRGEEATAEEARAMDVSLILYTEHEFNASTFSARAIASTLSDIYSAVTGAIGALKGPLHGGANERVLSVLMEVGKPENAEKWIRDALAKKTKVMGFGHRVYKDGDPRAKFLKHYCTQLAEKTGNLGLEKTADTIESVIWSEKKLPANVDWPCGRLYHYLRLPIEIYTPLFAVARVAGWSAHVMEQLANNRLLRPSGRYIGHGPRNYVRPDQR